LKTLILGGYGNFGARIARALARDAQVEVSMGGRDAAWSRRIRSQCPTMGTARLSGTRIHSRRVRANGGQTLVPALELKLTGSMELFD